MNTSFSEQDFIASTFSQVNIGDILAWLETPPGVNASEELAALHRVLTDLRRSDGAREQRLDALDRLYKRSVAVVATLVDSLAVISLPLHRRTRHLVRSVHTLLRTLAEDLQASLENDDEVALRAHGTPPEQVVWRIIYVLAQHLLISSLAASPAGVGVWKHLHQSFEFARKQQTQNFVPADAGESLQHVYHAAVLLGCAQPACFSSREVAFIAAYLARFADRVDPIDGRATGAAFWLDPERDAPAVACSRKPVPPQTDVRCFSCDRLGRLLHEQLGAIEAGLPPNDLPELAATPVGRGVLRRLLNFWGEPGKRHFPRRRQNYRAALCTGLGNLWRLVKDGADSVDTSSWMITNESPDGYAIMHVSGKAGSLAVGDITAVRSETGVSWQICIVRWALSENQEHLELGLQLLATRATPAVLALPSGGAIAEHLPVVVLPALPPLRASEMLVVPTGALEQRPNSLVLIVEDEKLKIREIRSTGVGEQNSQIEIFTIETDPLSV